MLLPAWRCSGGDIVRTASHQARAGGRSSWPAGSSQESQAFLSPVARRRAISEAHHLLFVISTPAISPGISAPAASSAPPEDPNVRLQVHDREPLSRSATHKPLRCLYGTLIYIQGCGSYGTFAFCGPRSTRRYGQALRKCVLETGYSQASSLRLQGLPFRLITDQANATPARLSSTVSTAS